MGTNYVRLLRIGLRCRHFHEHHAIPVARIKRLTNIYNKIIRDGLAYHEALIPLPCKGKQGRQPRRTGHNLLLRLFHYKQDVTNDLIRRVYEHKNKIVAGFTQKYNVDRLVYFEVCSGIVVAIEREKQIKGWSRKKKQDLIDSLNPEWDDLYRSLC